MDPTDAAHVMQTPEEYADFLSGMSFDKRIEMINSFRCAELQGAEELRVLSETTDDPDLAKKFARHAADEEKHGAYFGEIMRRLGVEPFDPPDEPDHITIGGRLIVDTLNDIEEILPQRGETVGLDRVIPILTLFQAVESRALVSFEAHRRTFERADPVIAERIGGDHRRREPPRPLRPHAARPVGRRGLGRRGARGAGGHRRPRGLGPRVGGRAPRGRAPARRGGALGVVTGGPAERRERILASLVRAGRGGGLGRGARRRARLLARGGPSPRGGPAARGPRRSAGAHDGYRLPEGADPVVPMLGRPAAGARPSPGRAVVRRDGLHQRRRSSPWRARARRRGRSIGADRQSAGRGRRGRAWLAAPGHALLVSVLLRPGCPRGRRPAADRRGRWRRPRRSAPTARIVWPNDILVGGRKMAGILCEMSADQERVAWAVAGIGVNVRSAPALDDARWEAGALGDLGDPPARADLLVDLLSALGRRYAQWVGGDAAGGARGVRRPRRAGRAADHGRAGGEEVAGVCAGTDDLGRLRLRTPAGERLLGAGEVVRVAPDDGRG